ncbi:MAG: undecaprenyldiphospho-muramoylpentapeptide beta-N-acetylglucosaminyltransferase [Clostridiales bacterium]|nr:undecaprenyldiphospho-muramoylpentapeptide beta-N-acetylglucosaminyltransferase [Clostridiales bacterium]
MKKIVLTGGGTAGHVSPQLALIPRLKELGYDIHYIGSRQGIERDLMAQQPVTYHTVKTGKLRRYFDWRNFTDPFLVIAGAFESLRLMGQIKPDVCFSKGGFVAVPVVIAAWMKKVPVLAHESDLTPGLANRISARFSKKVAATFPECAKTLGEKGVLTGTPLRPALFSGIRAKGLKLAGFEGDKPVLMMMGGSQGAQSLNKTLREALPQIIPLFDVLHLCGKGNLAQDLDNITGYFQAEFLSETLPDALACADLVLSRAGSNALYEFAALCKPMLLVPLPMSSSRGDQIQNAKSFEQRGMAQVLLQEELNAGSLLHALTKLQKDAPLLRSKLIDAPPADGTDKVLELIQEIQR